MENGFVIARFFLGRITDKSMKEGMGKNLEVGILVVTNIHLEVVRD